MKRIFLIGLLCLSVGFHIHATKIYTAPNGVDNWDTPGSGSQATPYNVQYGIWAASPGDSVLLQGTFALTQGIYLDKSDIYIGEWGTGAIITGSPDPNTEGLNMLVLKSVSNVVVEGLKFQQNWGNGARGIYLWGKGNNVKIKNCEFTNIGWSQSKTAIAPSGVGGAAIIALGNKNDGTYTNIEITGNAVSNCVTGWSESITVLGNVDGFLVADNWLSDNSNIGIDVAGHFSWVKDWDTEEPLNAALNQARNGRVRNNTVIRSISPIATAAGIYCDGCKNVTIERNIVKECGAGISLGCEVGGNKTASNVTVMNNIVRDCKESGLFLGSHTSEGSSQGPSSVDNCVVKNNTFYKNAADDTSNDYEVFLQNSKNNKFFNNILYIRNSGKGIVSAFEKVAENFTMDYNLFYRDNGSHTDLVVSAGNPLSGNANSQYGNPGFDGSDELNISSTSRAVNSGDPATTILSGELDRNGGNRKQSTNVDIGAQESSSTQAPSSPNFSNDEGSGFETVTIQGEDFSDQFGGFVSATHAGYNGTGYYSLAIEEAWVQYNINVVGGDYMLKIRFSNGTDDYAECWVEVNGNPVIDLFNATGGWDVWNETYIPVSLSGGMNTIKIRVYDGIPHFGVTGPNIDQLVLTTGTGLTIDAVDYSTFSGGEPANTHTGWTGGGYFNMGGNGTWAEYDFTVPVAGMYDVVTRYSNGSSTNRSCDITINGVVYPIDFLYTISWDNWFEISRTAALTTGTNTLRIEVTAGGGANIDRFVIYTHHSPLARIGMGTGIPEPLAPIQETGMFAYPNPASGKVSVHGIKPPLTIQILNVMGQRVKSVTTESNTLDISDLSQGAYLFNVNGKMLRMLKQ